MKTERILLLARAAQRAGDGSGRRIREQSSVSMRAIAAACGVQVATVSRWETGARQPRGEGGIRWVLLIDQLEAQLTAAAR